MRTVSRPSLTAFKQTTEAGGLDAFMTFASATLPSAAACCQRVNSKNQEQAALLDKPTDDRKRPALVRQVGPRDENEVADAECR
jgi:hypothetical protein